METGENIWIGLVAFKALKKSIIEVGQEAFVNMILYAADSGDFKNKAAAYFAGKDLEVFDFRQVEPYSYRRGFFNSEGTTDLVKLIKEDREPRYTSLTLFDPMKRIKWKTWLVEFHDLAFTGFAANFEESSLSLFISSYNNEMKLYENYKVTFTNSVKIKFDEYDLTDNTNKYGPEIFGLDIKEINNGIYEGEIHILYGERSISFLINLQFEDIIFEKLSESDNVKFRFGSWETRVDINPTQPDDE